MKDADSEELRDCLVAALIAEGLPAMVWQHWALPAHPVFRRPVGPWWSTSEDIPLRPWDPQEYPETSRVLAESLVLPASETPLMVQEPGLMERYGEVFEKVMREQESLVSGAFTPPRLPNGSPSRSSGVRPSQSSSREDHSGRRER